ncbi:hypothetical protein K7X08_024302 [Anisodus acutangulus]|uniref:Uncharacterized protein n=1 Tax=Anisodus acutangulus TaxID=402998 RepID=A0A9Q1M7L6_9SOLA|nr:hypothetical protein K7X08_024302 [Anisodus acutangulus]
MEHKLSTKLANTVVEDEGEGGALPPGVELEGPAADGVGELAPEGPAADAVGGLAPGLPVLETVIANFWPFRQCLPKVQI